jgi:hypothetical protein
MGKVFSAGSSAGAVMAYVRSIPVEAANGDRLTVYEFQDRRLVKRVRRWKLCTGEDLHQLGDALVVSRTGEQLTIL